MLGVALSRTLIRIVHCSYTLLLTSIMVQVVRPTLKSVTETLS